MKTDTWSPEFELKVKSIFEQFFSSGDASVLDELTAMGLSDMQILNGVKEGCGALVEDNQLWKE